MNQPLTKILKYVTMQCDAMLLTSINNTRHIMYVGDHLPDQQVLGDEGRRWTGRGSHCQERQEVATRLPATVSRR